jgi:hypothetical protein
MMIGSIAFEPTNTDPDLLAGIFAHADPQVVAALSGHAKALMRYLAQIHDLTIAETTETVEAFFGIHAPQTPQAEVA